MFHAYVNLITRHFNWLERIFPSIMFANRYDLRFIIKYLLVSPGLIVLILMPITALMFAILSLPIGDGFHLLLIVATIILLFYLIIKEALQQHSKPN
jgi:uncharacterized membrane protein